MDADTYQRHAHKTAIYGGELSYPYLGIAGEVGELCNQAKKIIRDDSGQLTAERKEKLLDELGDVLWYAAEIATSLGASLSDVMAMNLSKLENRSKTNSIKGDAR